MNLIGPDPNTKGVLAMCDDHSIIENEAYLKLSRRGFVEGAGAIGIAALWAGVAGAKANVRLLEKDVMVKTPDGTADCFLVHPAKGKHPAVILWPDIFGLRKTKKEMAKRLAREGYTVLVVNPYYRSAKAPVIVEGEELQGPTNWPKVREQATKLTADTNVTDAKAFVAFLDAQKSVNTKKKIGTMGYCMGGRMVLRAAAAVPDRIGAGASFHGSSHVTDKSDSPHLLIPKMKAEFLIAIADNDDQKDPTEKQKLTDAFRAAKLKSEIEVYKNAMHGWCPPDGKVYNHEQAERAWARMLVLFNKVLTK
jgi:carboxymethylenebutenolidase